MNLIADRTLPRWIYRIRKAFIFVNRHIVASGLGVGVRKLVVCLIEHVGACEEEINLPAKHLPQGTKLRAKQLRVCATKDNVQVYPKVELFISVLEPVKDPAGPTFSGVLVQLNVEPEGMIACNGSKRLTLPSISSSQSNSGNWSMADLPGHMTRA